MSFVLTVYHYIQCYIPFTSYFLIIKQSRYVIYNEMIQQMFHSFAFMMIIFSIELLSMLEIFIGLKKEINTEHKRDIQNEIFLFPKLDTIHHH
ncbi:unnamed protein product [Schistosoma margrebowiei]|uniref:Uncharacterized protein n=1 Tax=Schistosoma margrebowiei TaxID=48269 RepID=A0AA85A5W5_9TREM|nr:unnamed protein product [Schistosoma margrebowiei]